MITLLTALAISILLGITNAFAYKRGENTGYHKGWKTGINEQVIKTGENQFEIRIRNNTKE